MKWPKRLVGSFVSKFVLRSQLLPIGELKGARWLWAKLNYTAEEIKRLNDLWPEFVAKNEKYTKEHPDHFLSIKRQQLTTKDNCSLDTVELCSSKNEKSQEYVIYGWGRSDCYEYFLPRLATDALNLNKKIITFNFRNVGHSKGVLNHEQDLVSDYKFQVKRLIEQGVDPKNITCYGHSLCGAIAAFAVKELHEEGYPVRIYSDRSFSNLMITSINLFFLPDRRIRRSINTVGTIVFGALLLSVLFALSFITAQTALISALVGLASMWVPPIFAVYDKVVGAVLEKGLHAVMVYGEWVMDMVKTYEAIPAEYKIHTVLKTAKKTHSEYLGERKRIEPGHDKVILYPDTLHRNLKNHHVHKKELRSKFNAALIKGLSEEITLCKQRLEALANVKMTGGHHTAWPEELLTRYKTHNSGRWITGQEHFYRFVEPQGHHDRKDPIPYRKF
jgi:hypothetical protein